MKINHPLVKGKVKEIQPKIFCVLVDDNYDRAMLFCRYQEFYESPTKKFRGKYFSWAQYMRYYKDHWKKDTFTYPIDWSGYNIPSEVIDKAILEFGNESEYDLIMRSIFIHCDAQNKKKNGGGNWYLIGASSKDLKTLDHEIAHGLYFTNNDYKKSVASIIKKIKPSHYEKLRKKLVKMGYVDDKKIIDDEIQAFMSTGLYNGLDTKELKVYQKEFVANFKKY